MKTSLNIFFFFIADGGRGRKALKIQNYKLIFNVSAIQSPIISEAQKPQMENLIFSGPMLEEANMNHLWRN